MTLTETDTIFVETDTVPEIVLDWREYYLSFCQEHGDPAEYGGRLLFEDGWTYSAFDYAGPEWPPPEDKGNLKGLKITYWRLRRETVKAEAFNLQTKLRAINGLQRGKSMPLELRYRMPGELPGATMIPLDSKGNPIIMNLDVGAYSERLTMLEQDVEDCDERLRELGVKV